MDSDEWFKIYIQGTDKRLQNIESKLDEVLKFKWRIAGGIGLMSFCITIGFQLFFKT